MTVLTIRRLLILWYILRRPAFCAMMPNRRLRLPFDCSRTFPDPQFYWNQLPRLVACHEVSGWRLLSIHEIVMIWTPPPASISGPDFTSRLGSTQPVDTTPAPRTKGSAVRLGRAYSSF